MTSNLIVARLNDRARPMDRGDLYEDPLDAVLKKRGLGHVSGGGTQQGASGEIEFCDVDIELAGPATPETIAVIVDVLETRGAPKGSRLLLGRDAERPFGRTEGLAVYLNGTDLPAETYRTCDSNHVYAEFNRLLAPHARIHSYWQGPKETALYMYGPSYPEMTARLADFIAAYPLCAKGAPPADRLREAPVLDDLRPESWRAAAPAALHEAARKILAGLPGGWRLDASPAPGVPGFVWRDGATFVLVPGVTRLGFDVAGWRPTPAEIASFKETGDEYFAEPVTIEAYVASVTGRPRPVTQGPFLCEVTARPADAVVADEFAEAGLSHADLAARVASEGFALPSADEWEAACAGGASTLFHWGDQAPAARYPLASEGWERGPNAYGLDIAWDTYRPDILGRAGHRPWRRRRRDDLRRRRLLRRVADAGLRMVRSGPVGLRGGLRRAPLRPPHPAAWGKDVTRHSKDLRTDPFNPRPHAARKSPARHPRSCQSLPGPTPWMRERSILSRGRAAAMARSVRSLKMT